MRLTTGLLCFSPELRDLRRLMRYRHMMVQQSVRMHNKTAGLLMESGVSFHKTKLQGKRYFADLIKSLEEVPESVKDLLRMSRATKDMFEGVQNQLAGNFWPIPTLKQRVERLSSIDGVGEITALTWALEVGDPHRFASIADAVSYCGLTAALRSSAGKQQRGPISKQRNAWLQTALIEAAKLAPRWNPQLAQLHAQQLTRGHANRATLQVARKLVAYLLAVDKSGQPFQVRTPPPKTNSNEEKSKKASCQGSLAADSCLSGFVLSAVHQPVLTFVGTVHGSSLSQYTLSSVLRSAGLLSLNPRGRGSTRSRKWMSGHAATALVTPRIEDSSEPHPANRLGKPFSARSEETSAFP